LSFEQQISYKRTQFLYCPKWFYFLFQKFNQRLSRTIAKFVQPHYCTISCICVHAIDDAEDKVLASVNGENPEWCEMAEQPQEDGDEMESGFLFGSFFVPFSGVMRM